MTFDVTLTTAGTGAGVLTLGGNISGNGGFTQASSGTTLLSGTDTYSGGTTVNAGTLEINSSGSVTGNLATVANVANGTAVLNQTGGTLTSNTELAVGDATGSTGTYTQSAGTNAAKVLNLGVNTGASGTYNLNGGTLETQEIITNVGTSTFNFNGGTLEAAAPSANFMQGLTTATIGSGGAIINTNGNNVTIAQTLTGGTTHGLPDGGITKLGVGILTLSGSNFYLGGTMIDGGTLEVSSQNNLGEVNPDFSTDKITLNGGELLFSGSGTIGENVAVVSNVLSNTLSATQGGLVQYSGTLSGSGSLTVGDMNNMGTYNTGTVELSGANSSFTGGITTGVGILEVGNTNALVNCAVTVAQSNALTFSLGLGSANLGGLSGSGSFALADANNSAVNVTLGGNGSTTYSGNLSGAGALTKNGSGTLIMTGSNSNGGTIVNAGTIAGTGTLGGSVLINSGGTLAPGNNAPGQLITNANLTLASGSLLAIQLGGTTAGSGYSQVMTDGTISLAGNLSVTETNFQLAPGEKFYVLVDQQFSPFSSTISGTFANTTAGNIYTDAAGDTFLVDYADTYEGPFDAVSLTTLTVPEPSAGGFAVGGAMMLLLLRRFTNRERKLPL